MQLNYEVRDESGKVEEKVLEFGFRIPSSHAKTEFRKAQAAFAKRAGKFGERATAMDDSKSALLNQIALATDDKAGKQLEKQLLKIDEEIEAFTDEMDKAGDNLLYGMMRIAANSATASQLTDELLESSNLEEVREIVSTFRQKLGL